MIVRTLRLCGLPLRRGARSRARRGGAGLPAQRLGRPLLLDINMPVMNGEEMIEHLRADPRRADLRIIVVSTEGSDTASNASPPRASRSSTSRSHRRTCATSSSASPESRMNRLQLQTTLYSAAASTFEELALLWPSRDVSREGRAGAARRQRRGAVRRPAARIAHAARHRRRARRRRRRTCWPCDEARASSPLQRDAVGELANVICGSVLPRIAGRRAVFRLGAPQWLGPGQSPDSAAIAATRLGARPRTRRSASCASPRRAWRRRRSGHDPRARRGRLRARAPRAERGAGPAARHRGGGHGHRSLRGARQDRARCGRTC